MRPTLLSLYRDALRSPQVWRRTLLLGLPVGLFQAALNQGDHWLRHQVDAAIVAKTLLSPLVTLVVALGSALTTRVETLQRPPSTHD